MITYRANTIMYLLLGILMLGIMASVAWIGLSSLDEEEQESSRTEDEEQAQMVKQDFIYSVSKDSTVRKIDLEGQEVWSFDEEGEESILSLAVGQDGIYTGSEGGMVRHISFQGQEIWSNTEAVEDVNALTVDDKGAVYAGGESGVLMKLNSEGEMIWKDDFSVFTIHALAHYEDALYVGYFRNVAKLTLEGEEVWEDEYFDSRVTDLEITDQGIVYASSWDESVGKITSKGEKKSVFEDYEGFVKGVTVGSGGSVYTAAGFDIFKVTQGELDWVHENAGDGFVEHITIDNDGQVYFTSGSRIDKTNESLKTEEVFAGHDDDIMDIRIVTEKVENTGSDFSRDKKTDDEDRERSDSHNQRTNTEEYTSDNTSQANIYAGGYDHILRKITSQGTEEWRSPEQKNNIRSLAVDDEGNMYIGSFKTLIKMNPQGEEVWRNTYQDWVNNIVIDDNRLYITVKDNKVLLLSLTGEVRRTYTDHTQDDPVSALRYENDGMMYVAYGDVVRKFALDETGIRHKWEIQANSSWVRDIELDSQGNVYLATDAGYLEKRSSEGDFIEELSIHDRRIEGMAIDSQDNLYTVSQDTTVKKTDKNGDLVWTFDNHADQVKDIVHDKQGNVYTISFDDTLKKIDQNGEEVWSRDFGEKGLEILIMSFDQ